ncbi:SatD family protein [Vallitalea okinawensis]|uniref:SatD family protein n=1 Tax=Vallitalea okinawensis TaxID=2078660 RepID=UPI000CFAAC43|nr:SatD family protein [Vallitalea okinawensis]
MYITITCDLKQSRQLKNREEVQYKLINMLKEVNKHYKSHIASEFIITLGDEWQGLLHYPCDFMDIIDYFRKYMAGIQFYVGIGIGDVTIHNFELTVNQLDGPSFYNAREALKIAKANNYSLVVVADNWDYEYV